MNYCISFFLMISTLSFSQAVQNFTLTNVTDGKSISLNNYSNYSAVVVIFTSNDCPFDQYYLDRIRTLAETYAEKVPVLLINSHDEPKETITEMKRYAAQCKLSIPYLADKDQKVLGLFNARKSPEAFLLKNTSGKFTIVYKGAIDDNAQTATEVMNMYLKIAIDNLLAGEKIDLADTRPMGCSIRKN